MGRLYWKFFLFLLLAQLTASVGVSFVFWMHNRQEAVENAGIEMSRPARSMIEAAAATLRFGGIQGLTNLLDTWQQQPMPQVFAVDAQGQELLHRSYTASALATANKLAQGSQTRNYTKRIHLKNGQSYLLFVPDVEGGGDAFSRLHPPPPDRERIENMRPPKPLPRFPFAPLLGGSIVSLIFAAMLAWYFSKPIKNLRLAFAQASNGNLDTRIGVAMGSRKDELADLGRGFDTMASRLGSLIQGQTRLLHHVSHELRSPLARMQIAIGLAKQSEDKVGASLDRIQLESERMDSLIGELLQLSKLESGMMDLHKEKIDLTPLLDNLITDAKFEAKEQGINIESHIQKGLVVFGEPELLYRAIENVVRNAIKYSHASGQIIIDVSKNSIQKIVFIKISDQGPGVPEDELEAIFQPFIRSSHSQKTDGHGVGLAIAKQIVEAHGGKIHAQNQLPKGLQVVIELQDF